MVRRSLSASKRKFERIGIVVLRSTTDCAAVSSRRSSARETVISRLPVGADAEPETDASGEAAVVTAFGPPSSRSKHGQLKNDRRESPERDEFLVNNPATT